MREYGQIQCSFWQRACEEEWSNDAMLLGAYLLTGPHSNGIGCYRLPTGYVSDDLDWDKKRVEQTLSELSGKGFCNRFGRVVLVPKFLRWNPISNANVAIARQREFEAVPNDEAKRHAALALLDFGSHWDEAFVKRLETLSKGLPKQNPTLPNPTQKEHSPTGESVSPDGKTPAPHQKIVDLYHELCPHLPSVVKMTPARKQALGARWRNELKTLEAWRAYFETVAASDFLSGRAKPRPGSEKAWSADFGWLIKQDNCVKVMEGKYDD